MDETLVFSPYNPVNREITEKEVMGILKQYGLPIQTVYNMELFKRAFIHKSYVKRSQQENEMNNIIISDCPSDSIQLKTKSNERLEFLGDSVLENTVRFYIYKRFPKENEGFMTEKKIKIVQNENIGKLAKYIGLDKWFIMSKHAEEKGTRNNLKKLGCLFEAFIGSIFLTYNKLEVKDEHNWYKTFTSGPGYQMAEIFVVNVLEKHIDWVEMIEEDNNYKNILQVKIQKEFKVTPKYIIHEENDDGYNMGVYLVINHDNEILDRSKAENINELKKFLTKWYKYEHDVISYKEKLDISNNTYNTIEIEMPQIFILLATGVHKIKKKAEQLASLTAINEINKIIE
jgi:dsRNA-specific ribonuclease